MVRKLRLISSNSIEIAVTGINSPFLDNLLTDHPHKVATISIPFSDKAVVDFAKNVANPDRELNRCAARKIVSIYKLLGIDIEVEAANENTTTNVSNTEVGEPTALDYEFDVENVEPKYIIKIELGQEHSSSSEGESENVCEEVDPEMVNSRLEANDNNVSAEESAYRQTPVSNIPTSSLFESCNELVRDQTELHSDISVSDNVIDDVNENAEFIETRTNDLVDQAPENMECDSTDKDIDADFSFYDLVEESSQDAVIHPSYQSNQTIMRETIQNCSQETGNVISNILNLTASQGQFPSEVLPSSHLAVSKLPLRLEFIKTGLDIIKDITKKRKRKRGQH